MFFRYLLEEQGIRNHQTFLPPYREAAARLGLTGVDPAPKTFEGWLYNGRRPQTVFCRVIVEMLGYSIDDLWTEVPDDGPRTAFVPLTQRALPGASADSGMALTEMTRTGHMAVRRAREFLLGKERESIGDDTLGLLDDEMARLVAAYPSQPLSTLWPDLLETQEQVFRLLEGGRARPSQLRDLNLKAAVLSFLVAKGLHDMSEPHQAMTMTRVAASCARDAEHPALSAMTDGLMSLIAYWTGRAEDAYHYASKGAVTAAGTTGTAGLWLLGLQARAAAALGNAEAVRTATSVATSRRDHVIPDDLDRLGGILTYTNAKQTYYEVEAAALLGHSSPHLVAQAEDAVTALTDPALTAWAFGDLAGARCNLAIVRLGGGDIDGAAEAMRPTLDLPAAYRTSGIAVSARRVHGAVLASAARDATVARDLRAEIESFPVSRAAIGG
ncbi:hypothetical protein FQU76_09870 [Streptomyces qinzhouensis]|uniref:XRE family transcriptional regulator n=1 Tax=Streptomyces qinzhouensis TaxID=2599401 RepID=A0A5B8IQD9_9ACTN|nr:hypothetical protein FQU76_09870 [Streptomyces qinzhouensis]